MLADDLVTVNDKECFELTGELDGDLFSEMMQTDLTDSLSGYGIDEETLSDMVFPCTIDVYKDSISSGKAVLRYDGEYGSGAGGFRSDDL